jgi:hypothetical protein
VTDLRDLKAMLGSADPAQIVGMDSFFGITFEGTTGAPGVTAAVIDFTTVESALAHWEVVSAGVPGEPVTPAIADRSLQLVEAGSVAVLVFMKGDVLVTLNATGGSIGQSELDALVSIARTMAGRL